MVKHLERGGCSKLSQTPIREKREQINNNYSRKMLTPVVCKFCGLNFKRQFTLETHLRKFHENQIDLPKFDTDTKLSEDVIREMGLALNDLHSMHTAINGIFKCLVCYKHVSVVNFMDHLRFHTGDYVAYCKMCNKGFNRKVGYQMHMKKHMGAMNGPIKRGRRKCKPSDYVTCERCKHVFKGVCFFSLNISLNK